MSSVSFQTVPAQDHSISFLDPSETSDADITISFHFLEVGVFNTSLKASRDTTIEKIKEWLVNQFVNTSSGTGVVLILGEKASTHAYGICLRDPSYSATKLLKLNQTLAELPCSRTKQATFLVFNPLFRERDPESNKEILYQAPWDQSRFKKTV